MSARPPDVPPAGSETLEPLEEMERLAARLPRAHAESLLALLSRERAARVALLDQSERFRGVLSSPELVVFECEPEGGEGVVRFCNEAGAALLDLAPAEVVGRSMLEFVGTEDVSILRAALFDAVGRAGSAEPLEFRALRRSGERRVVRVTIAAIGSGSDRPLVQIVGSDVSGPRAAETRMRRAERIANIAFLLRGVCHELNNPLTSIKSFAELLLLDDRAEDDREALEIIRREAGRAAKILTELRIVAAESRGEAPRTLLDIATLVQEVARPLTPRLAGEGIRVRQRHQEGLPPVWGAAAQLSEVVRQLLANAEQAVRGVAGPREISIETHPSAIGVALRVQDSGAGIDPADRDRVFDPFYTTRDAGEGTGLGLSIVQGIVHEHGGTVLVESEPGRGACFIVQLPAVRSETPAAVAATESARPSSGARSLRILVADDEAPIRFSLCRFLERRGHRVEEAAEARAALARIDAAVHDPFDVLVVDLRMPGLPTEALLDAIAARRDGLIERVVFITGSAEGDEARRVLGAAADAPVLLKPFDLERLGHVVEGRALAALVGSRTPLDGAERMCDLSGVTTGS